MSNAFFGEMFGTLVLILLGNGVVACALLKKSYGEGSGWLVITDRLGFCRYLRRIGCADHRQRCAHQSGHHYRCRDREQRLESGSYVHPGPNAWCNDRSHPGLAALHAALA